MGVYLKIFVNFYFCEKKRAATISLFNKSEAESATIVINRSRYFPEQKCQIFSSSYMRGAGAFLCHIQQ